MCLLPDQTGASQIRNFYYGFLWHSLRQGHRIPKGNKTQVFARVCLNFFSLPTGSLRSYSSGCCEDWFFFLQVSKGCNGMSTSIFLWELLVFLDSLLHAKAYVYRSENTHGNLFSPFTVQSTRLGNRYLYPLNHPTGPYLLLNGFISNSFIMFQLVICKDSIKTKKAKDCALCCTREWRDDVRIP